MSPLPDSLPYLRRIFYERDTTAVARALLGKWVFSRLGGKLTAGIIIETEAYLPQGDPASHAAKGMTPRNRSMFAAPGTAYVYAIHSRHCFNVVTESPGIGAAVLIRALEPREGIAIMRTRRSSRRSQPPTERELCSGPAKLCEALGIDLSQDGSDLTGGRKLWLAEVPGASPVPVRMTRRIGVTSAQELRLRFVWAEHPGTSRPRLEG